MFYITRSTFLNILFLNILLSFFNVSEGQQLLKSEQINFPIDSINNKATSKKCNAFYYKINDSSYEKRIYQLKGPCIESAKFSDPAFQNLSGRYCDYDELGVLVHTGNYTNNKKTGIWFREIDTMQYEKDEYRNDTLIRIVDSFLVKIRHDSIYSISDTARPIFPGGMKGLKTYLVKSILQSGIMDKTEAKLTIAFFIDTSGKTFNEYIWKSKNKIADDFALKLISSMPLWTPAKNTKTGNSIVYYLRQPLEWRMN